MPEEVAKEHGYAVLRCTSCDETFETSLHPQGQLLYDGVRNHGEKHKADHLDSEWDYNVVERNPA